MTNPSHYFHDAVALLQRLIATPSTSRNEQNAADIIEATLGEYGFKPHRHANNVWAILADSIEDFEPEKPGTTLLLNAHLDTVKPVSSWTHDPFRPTIDGGRLYGLGANDDGGGLVTLLQTFRRMRDKRFHQFNVVFLASAEEEISGPEGMESVLPKLPKIDVAIVGEPTGLQPAVAEKGLMVVDLIAHGKSGHAARDEGENAIYKILDDLRWLRDYRFERVSPFLGPTKMTVTVIHAGTQHNVVPDLCTALIDVRTNELYTNEEVFDLIQTHCRNEVHAHSFRLKSSHIPLNHPLVERCTELGLKPFGSPTLSDQALMPFPSFKLGPGESSRSHSADEFILLDEIRHALDIYAKLLLI